MRSTTFLPLALLLAAAWPRPALAGSPYCFGDGSLTACPCGNVDTTGTGGCLNFTSPPGGPGAVLSSTGSEVLLTDGVLLTVTGMRTTTAVLFFQGTLRVAAGAGATFGDGLHCAGGTIVRLAIKSTTTGTSNYPESGDALVHIKGQVTAAGSRYYQCWYRDPAPLFCTSSFFNLSNGLEIAWT